jgi:2-keto-4-pentenoate hydratase/2-oxohepta-3-ene-1,7-dioic acid hydratase in catechol pathway
MTNPWDENAEMSDAVLTVKILLNPLPRGTGDLRAVGLNYKDHAVSTESVVILSWCDKAEMKLPLPDVPSIFFKSRMAITGPGTAIKVPKIAQNEEMDYEVELAIIIGKDCLNVQEADALDHVLGYTCANDLTARKVQDTSSQWTFAKSQSSLDSALH